MGHKLQPTAVASKQTNGSILESAAPRLVGYGMGLDGSSDNGKGPSNFSTDALKDAVEEATNTSVKKRFRAPSPRTGEHRFKRRQITESQAPRCSDADEMGDENLFDQGMIEWKTEAQLD